MEAALRHELESRIPELVDNVYPTLPSFAQGGLPMSKNLFMCYGDSEPELIGRLGKSGHHANNEQLIDCIRKAVEQGINNCAFKVGG